MRNCYYLLVMLLLTCSVMAQDDVQHRKDSLHKAIEQTEGREKLRTYNRLAGIYFGDVDNDEKMNYIFSLYDAMQEEAERQGNKAYQGMAIVNKIMVLINRMMYDRVIEQSLRDLEFLEQHEIGNQYYYYVYKTMLQAWQHKGEFEKAIEGSREMYAKAQADDYQTGMGLALYTQAKVCKDMNKLDEFLELSRASIPLLEGLSSNISMISTVWGDICMVLLAQERYDEALEAATELQKTVEQLEELAGAPVPSARSNVNGVFLNLYLRLKDYEKLEYYCNLIEASDTNDMNNFSLYKAWAHVYNHREQYDLAIEKIRQAEELIDSDYSTERLYLLGTELEIAAKREKAVETYRLVKEMDAITDSIRKLEVHRQIDEIRTEYEVDRLILEKERNRNYAYMASIGLLLALLTLGIWIAYSRRLGEKNRNLVRRLREQDELDRRLEEERASMAKLRLSMRETELLSGEMPLKITSDPLYDRLLELMSEQVYTDPELNRASLAAWVGTNERYLSDLIKRHFDQTVSGYINDHRLRYARQKLADPNTEFTIEAIALDSGFGSRGTFHKLFRKQYGLSPSEFRHLSLEEAPLLLVDE